MSNKKNNNKRNKNNINNFPLSNEIKLFKNQFKKMIDDMPDEEFVEMIQFLMFSEIAFEDELDMYEEWDDETEEIYNNGKQNPNNLRLIKNDDDI